MEGEIRNDLFFRSYPKINIRAKMHMTNFPATMINVLSRMSKLPLDGFARFRHLYVRHSGEKYKRPHPTRYGTKCVGMQHPLVLRTILYSIVRYGTAENIVYLWKVNGGKIRNHIVSYIILFERVDAAKLLPREIFGDKIKTHVWPLKCSVYLSGGKRGVRVWDIEIKCNHCSSFYVGCLTGAVVGERDGDYEYIYPNGKTYMTLDDYDDQNRWGHQRIVFVEPENYYEPDRELGKRFMQKLDN